MWSWGQVDTDVWNRISQSKAKNEVVNTVSSAGVNTVSSAGVAASSPVVDKTSLVPSATASSIAARQSPQSDANDGQKGTLVQDSRVVAVVGNQTVVAGELTGVINRMLEPYIGKASESQLNQHREKLMKQLLPKIVENKLLAIEFLKQIPADKRAELEQEVIKEFHKSELDKLLEKEKVASAAELDDKLRKFGSSLDKQQRTFLERMMGQQAIAQNVDFSREPTHDELLAEYYKNQAEYEFPTKVKFEKMSVDIAAASSREAAWEKIAKMGNEVVHGASFEAVAKRSSDGPRAADGGQYDFISQGSLAWEKLDERLFSQPVGKLSEIIEDNGHFHITRVIQRQEAGKVPFEEAQEDIRLTLKQQHVNDQIKEFIDELRDQTYVWTVYDSPSDVTEVANKPGESAARF